MGNRLDDFVRRSILVNRCTFCVSRLSAADVGGLQLGIRLVLFWGKAHFWWLIGASEPILHVKRVSDVGRLRGDEALTCEGT
jgi:hypothetical protein